MVLADNITISTDALQDGIRGILVAFDAREARASISIDDLDVSAGQGVSIEGKSR